MVLVLRRNPLAEIEQFQNEINRMFNHASTGDFKTNNLAFTPAAEMEETAETINLNLELPGIKVEDIEIKVTAKAVLIQGERKSEMKTETDGKTRTEFRYGQFQRVIPLPAKIQNTAVEAEYKDGILHLTLPKAEEEKNKVVKVNLS